MSVRGCTAFQWQPPTCANNIDSVEWHGGWASREYVDVYAFTYLPAHIHTCTLKTKQMVPRSLWSWTSMHKCICKLQCTSVYTHKNSHRECMGWHSCRQLQKNQDIYKAQNCMHTTQKMAEVAASIAKDHGLTCKILDLEECTKLGMGAYLGVSQGGCMCLCVSCSVLSVLTALCVWLHGLSLGACSCISVKYWMTSVVSVHVDTTHMHRYI